MRRESLVVQEVGIVRDNDSLLVPGRREHILVAFPAKVDIVHGFRVVAIVLKESRYLNSSTFIDEKSRLPSVLCLEATQIVFGVVPAAPKASQDSDYYFGSLFGKFAR